MGPTPKCHFVLGFPSWIVKFLKLGLPWILGPIILCANLRLRWSLKQSCSLRQELSIDIRHITCIKGNQGDYWLLVVKSQIDNLTPDLSFGHNLCFKCPNGSCEFILNIYVSKAFQWYNPMSFDPCNYPLNIWEFIEISTPKVGVHFGSVEVHSLTFSYTTGSMKCDSRTSPLTHTFTSPCLNHKPKTRVVTNGVFQCDSHNKWNWLHPKWNQ
jgi:hypothetical protein